MDVAVLVPPFRFFRLGGECRYDTFILFFASSLGSLQKCLRVWDASRKRSHGADPAVAHRPHHRQEAASAREADRPIPLFVVDQLVIQVQRIVVQRLLEFGGRYLVGGQVLRVPSSQSNSMPLATYLFVSRRIYVELATTAFSGIMLGA